MINPGHVAQGRALTRLGQEFRERYRRLYADAPNDKGRTSRRGWALRQLSLEQSARYRELYAEETAARSGATERPLINPGVVGSASGPGPWHAVLADGSATVCGRSRFRVYPVTPEQQMNCTYCADELREKPTRDVDPHFAEQAELAEARLREYADLQNSAAAARAALVKAVVAVGTPPAGTAERIRFVEILNGTVGTGITMQEIGDRRGVSRERIRQIVAEYEAVGRG